MPDESCRRCGGPLLDFAQCAECKKIISMICKSCRNKTPEQFHSKCLIALNGHDSKKFSQDIQYVTLA